MVCCKRHVARKKPDSRGAQGLTRPLRRASVGRSCGRVGGAEGHLGAGAHGHHMWAHGSQSVKSQGTAIRASAHFSTLHRDERKQQLQTMACLCRGEQSSASQPGRAGPRRPRPTGLGRPRAADGARGAAARGPAAGAELGTRRLPPRPRTPGAFPRTPRHGLRPARSPGTAAAAPAPWVRSADGGTRAGPRGAV